jgi:hypothetical protein
MSQSVIPVAKQVLIRDDVVLDPTSRKPHLVNLGDTVRASGPFPWRLPKNFGTEPRARRASPGATLRCPKGWTGGGVA